MRVTVRQLKRIISEAMGDDRRDGMSWSMPYGYAGHSRRVSVVEPLYAASGNTPSVGAQIATLWSTFQAEPQGRGPGGAEMLQNPDSTGGLIGLFRKFLNFPSIGTAAPEGSPLEAAFDAFTNPDLPMGVKPDVRASVADAAYEALATLEEAGANEAARGRSTARFAPRPAAMPGVATESLRRDLRRRLRSL